MHAYCIICSTCVLALLFAVVKVTLHVWLIIFVWEWNMCLLPSIHLLVLVDIFILITDDDMLPCLAKKISAMMVPVHNIHSFLSALNIVYYIVFQQLVFIVA